MGIAAIFSCMLLLFTGSIESQIIDRIDEVTDAL